MLTIYLIITAIAFVMLLNIFRGTTEAALVKYTSLVAIAFAWPFVILGLIAEEFGERAKK
jgi:hypothetical protein